MKRASFKDAAFTSPCTKYQHPPWNTSILGDLVWKFPVSSWDVCLMV